jgi:dihydroorotase
MKLLLRGGLVIGPTSAQLADVLIVDGRIAAVGLGLDDTGADVVDATGCWVGPAFVDIHTHLREPGREAAETVASGARAGALGGYGAIVAMPNTEPALDSVALVSYVLAQGAKTPLDVAVAGAITVGRQGERLAPLAEMAALGVRLFTDDGTGVQNPLVMRRALDYAGPLGLRLAQHCEDEALANHGVMHEGAVSARLGLVGRAALAEELMVQRDIELVRLTGGRLHFLHLSTARSLAMVAAAKAEGLDVTCEVAPHHFTLTDEACGDYNPQFKVHPPLRPETDRVALQVALAQPGLIDAVATDHAPHTPELKDLPFDEAPAGMLGLEQAAALTLEALGGATASPVQFFQLLSRGPARVAQLRASDQRVGLSAHGGAVAEGEDANLVIFDPTERWTVSAQSLASRATNTPYDGRSVLGRVRTTIVKGHLVVRDGVLKQEGAPE